MPILALLAALLAPQACPAGAPGTLAYARGGALHVVSLADCRDRIVVRRGASGPVRFVREGRFVRYGDRWIVPVRGGRPRRVSPGRGLRSPDGRLVATVRVARRPGADTGSQAIWVSDRRGGARAIYTLPQSYRGVPAGTPGPIGLVMWSPDSRWIFFYVDPMGSASIAADGLTLQALPLGGGAPRKISEMLLYRDYLSWCGETLVLVTGGSRLATENKRLTVAVAPTWRPRLLVRDRRVSWASPACAPDGRRLAVLSQPVSHQYAFAKAHWSVWVVGLDGSRRRVTEPPGRESDESPRWAGRDELLFVRRGPDFHGRLMLWRRGRIGGPLLDLGRDIGYYGHHDWWFAADWHR